MSVSFIGSFCSPDQGSPVRGGLKWNPAFLGAPGYPDEDSEDATYCDWVSETKTLISFPMCTFNINSDTQVSAVLHREGYWNGWKMEMVEKALPPLNDVAERVPAGMDKPLPARGKDPFPERTMTLDIGANLGFFTMIFATRGYDVISIEPNPEALIRLAFSLRKSGIRVATDGAADVSRGKGANRHQVVHLFQNAAADGYYSTTLKRYDDNPGANYVDWNPTSVKQDKVVTVPIDDLLDGGDRALFGGESAKDGLPTERPPKDITPVLDPRKIRAIKISAEGFDSRVINGLRRTLTIGKVPYVFFVYNRDHVKNQSCDPDKMIRNMFEFGYRIYFAGIYIYREEELVKFMKGLTGRSTELLFVGPGVFV